jgi:hypothetical protein
MTLGEGDTPVCVHVDHTTALDIDAGDFRFGKVSR